MYLYPCINICHKLTRHRRGVVMNKKRVLHPEAKLQSELESLRKTHTTLTMAASVSPAGALIRKALLYVYCALFVLWYDTS